MPETGFDIDQHILTPNFASGLTLEDFIERALVHMFAGGDFNESLSILSSEKTAAKIFDYIVEQVQQGIPLTENGTPPELTDKVLDDDFIAEIIDDYDGFHKSDLLFHRLKELLEVFPHPITLRAILRNRENFIEKIKVLISFIVQRKQSATHHSGLEQFVYDFGEDRDLQSLERGDMNAATIIESVMHKKSGDIQLVPCGEGGRFKCYRVKIRRKGKVGIAWEYTDLVVKVMKPIIRSQTGMQGEFAKFHREHELTVSSFGDLYIPDTHFSKMGRDGIKPLQAMHPELDRLMVYQEYVNGESVLGACKDPFLATDLVDVLPAYIELYEQMAAIHGKVIDCASIGKRNVLVRRKLIPRSKTTPIHRDELRIQIVDTNNLITVGSAVYEKMFVDRHTGENHYLRRLQQYVRDRCLPEHLQQQ